MSRVPLRALALAALAPLAACGTEELVIRPATEGCTDYDPEAPPEERIEVEEDGADVRVVHVGVFAPSDAFFDPDLGIDGRRVEVRERWTEGEEDDACFSPVLVFESPPSGRYSVSWIIGDDATPFDTVEFRVD